MITLEAEGSPNHCLAKLRDDLKLIDPEQLPRRASAHLDILIERGVSVLTHVNSTSIHVKLEFEPGRSLKVEVL
jgi:hypothetical protein